MVSERQWKVSGNLASKEETVPLSSSLRKSSLGKLVNGIENPNLRITRREFLIGAATALGIGTIAFVERDPIVGTLSKLVGEKQPAHGALIGTGNKNYYLVADPKIPVVLTGLTVRATAQTDIRLPSNGFSIQLNAYPLFGSRYGFLQFVNIISEPAYPDSFELSFTAWDSEGPSTYKGEQPAIVTTGVPLNPIPRGYSFEASLGTDGFAVNKYTLKYIDTKGNVLSQAELPLDGSMLIQMSDGTIVKNVPIAACTMDVVGYGNGEYANFLSPTAMQLLYNVDQPKPTLIKGIPPFVSATDRVGNTFSISTTKEDSNLNIYEATPPSGWELAQLLSTA